MYTCRCTLSKGFPSRLIRERGHEHSPFGKTCLGTHANPYEHSFRCPFCGGDKDRLNGGPRYRW